MIKALLDNRKILCLRGADTIHFLQGLISNDIRKLENGEAIYSALLTPQGKFLHDFFIISNGDEIFIDVAKNRAEDLVKRLNFYKLRSNLQIEETDFEVGAHWGKQIAETKNQNPEIIKQYKDPRLPEIGFRTIQTASKENHKTNNEFYEIHRLSLSIPDTSDMIVEKSLLLECGFEELNGVDFSKGCYIGQEVTTRSKFRGNIKKGVFQITSDNHHLPPLGSPIVVEEKVIGEMRTSVGNMGIAIVNLEDAKTQNIFCAEVAVKLFSPIWKK